MNTIFKKMNIKLLIHFSILFTLTCLIDFYFVNKIIFTDVPNISDVYRTLLSVMTKIGAVSGVLLTIYIGLNSNARLYIKLSIATVVFLISNYFILVTRNLNNKSFELLNFSGNDFFQLSSLKWVLIIVVLSSLIAAFFKNSRIEKINDFLIFDQTGLLTNFLVGLLVSLLLFGHSGIELFFQTALVDLTEKTMFKQYLFNSCLTTIVVTGICVLITVTVLKAFRHIRRLEPTISLSFSTSLLLALLFNYYLQYGVKSDSDLLGQYIFTGATLFQIGFLLLSFFLLFLITNRYIPTTLFIIALGIIASITNILKQSMRSEPLLITDLAWLREIGLISSFVSKQLIIQTVVGIIITIVVGWYLHNHVIKGKIVTRLALRISLIASTILVFLYFFVPFYHENQGKIPENIPISSVLNNENDINWLGFSTSARYKSLAYVWTKQLTNRIMTQPPNYSKAEIQRIEKKYEKLAESINQTRTSNISNQTVIYILSESLANPNRISSVTVSKDVLPNISSIKDQTTSGLMHSDSFGGGTANMEFQTLTGLPFYNFSPSVSVLYSEVFPKMKVQLSISDNFKAKNRLAFHPADANNFNRKSVYNTLKFNKFFTTTGSKDTFKNIENVGLLPSDKSVYNNVLSEINPKESQFFSVITMQNHIPWSSDYPDDITANGNNFTDEENRNLTSYVRLLSFTDSDTNEFLNQLTKIDKHITVVFYGDHLPGFYPDSSFENNLDLKYQTDYFIWSNFAKEKKDYPLINSSDFTAALLDHTNSKVSPYYALLTEVLQKASITNDKDSTTYKTIQTDLKNIQYDMTVGKGYILENKNFFKLK